MSSAQSQASSIVFEPRSGETWRDPFPMYKALRDHDPVHRFENEQGEFWTLSRFKDGFAAAVAAKTFSSAKGLTLDYEDMASILGVTRPQVGTLLFRAKRRLRAALADSEGEPTS